MIKAGIAGLGRWGQTLVNSVHGKSDKIVFTAGCTGRKARAQDYCDEKGIDLRDGLADLLNDPDLDAVVLATPHSQHADQVIAAAAAGKQIFIEKPSPWTVPAPRPPPTRPPPRVSCWPWATIGGSIRSP